MTSLLLFLSFGLFTLAGMLYHQLLLKTQAYEKAQKRAKEIDQQYKYAQGRIQQLEQKYGWIISREEVQQELDTGIQQSRAEANQLTDQIKVLQDKLKPLEEKDFIESFGFYESKYDFQEATDYKQRLDSIRTAQKQLIKDRTAAICNASFTLEGSAKAGKKMTDSFLKLILRAFNGECDAAVSKVKYNNVHTMENRIKKAYDELNKLSQVTHCEITTAYLELKLQELYLTHEYQEKKAQEQEEQRLIREQMREEERAEKELEKARQEAEREERRYQEALEKARRDVEGATGKAQQKLQQQIEELQQRLAEAEVNKERAISRAQTTKSGHVYVISNIGAFGENVYKIGMTRRLEPTERVKELSAASVPFPFDVHAMIYCENAPELENQLHRYFSDRRLNKINERKEFFRVSLSEIVEAVKHIDTNLQTCKSEVKFTMIAEAAEYRQTLAKERKQLDHSLMVSDV